MNGRTDRPVPLCADLKSKNCSFKSPVVVGGIRSRDKGSTWSVPRLPSFISSFNISKALSSSFASKINLNSVTMLPLLKIKRE